MVVRLREELSDFLIVTDPSHIAGNRNLIERVSQTDLDLKQGASLGLDENFVSKIFHSIHQESILIQSKLSHKK